MVMCQRFQCRPTKRGCIRANHQTGAVQRGLQQASGKFCLILNILFLLAFLDLIQRRLRDVDMPALDQFPHLSIEKSQ